MHDPRTRTKRLAVGGAGNVPARRIDTNGGYNVGNMVRKEEGDHRKHLREPSVHSLLRGEVCIGVGIAYQPKCKEEQNRTGGTRWAPPPTGMAKLNVDVDAVVSKGSNRGGHCGGCTR